MSAAFLERLRHLHPETWHIISHYRTQPGLSLSDSQFQVVSNIFRVLSDVSRTDSPSRAEMQEELLKVLFLMLQEYSMANSREQNLSPREELFSRFYQAIEEHYRESHEVQFYADLFGLTPKHFAAIIKGQTGIKALTWINNYVAMQAKSMLRHMQQLSIQQVAEQTGFSEQATFSRFFKAITGKTPSEYRNQTN